MPTGQRHCVGTHAAHGAEVGDGIAGLSGGDTVKADARIAAGQIRCLGLAVEDDQLVSRLLLAGGLALLTLLLMLEAEVQALAGQDAAQEGEITLAILRADVALGQRLGDIQSEIGLRVFLQDGAGDVGDAHVLKQEAVAAAVEEGEEGFQP